MRTFRTYNEVEGDTGGAVPAQVAAQQERLRRRLADIGAVWLVASGKGGVGKSAVTANLAAALADRGLRVGALDGDLNGPSLARMLGAARGSLRVDDDGVAPARGAAGTRVVSTDLLLGSDDEPMGWRGPAGAGEALWQSTLETGTLREFLADVAWGPLDVLLIDLPPGTDKLRRAFELVPDPAGVLVVTTPSEAARFVVLRSIRLVRELDARRVGLIANMSGHACSACGHHEPLFEDDGAARLVAETGVELWAEVPFHPRVARATDHGRPLVLDAPDNPAAAALAGLADRVAAETGLTRVAAGPTTEVP